MIPYGFMISFKAIYQKNPDFVQRDVAGEYILVPIKRTLNESNCIFTLNSTGAEVWKRFDGCTSLADIQNALKDEFNVTEDILEKDLTVLCDELLSIEAIVEKK